MRNRLVALGWHNVDPTPFFASEPGAGRRGFDRQLAMLSRFANVIPYPDAVDIIERGARLPPRAVVLTFDDGYQDAIDAVVPALARHGLPATFFLNPGFLSGRLGAWWEDLADVMAHARTDSLEWDGVHYDLSTAEARQRVPDTLVRTLKLLDQQARDEAVARIRERIAPHTPSSRTLFLDWEGASKLVASGYDVGSHTSTHAILSRETDQSQWAEIADSRTELESGLGRTIDTFAYPNGGAEDYDKITLRHLQDAGYRGALTTCDGLAHRADSLYEMKRVMVNPFTDVREIVKRALRAEREVRGRMAA